MLANIRNKMSEQNHRYKWLYEKLFSDSFEWNKGKKTTFEKLFQNIELGDSGFYKILNSLDNSVILILQFYTYGHKEIADFKNQELVFLIIKIPKVYNLYLKSEMLGGSIISESNSELILKLDKEKFVEICKSQNIINNNFAEDILSEDIYKTRIEDVCNGYIELIHKKEIILLFIQEQGEIIPLSKEF